MAFRIAFEISRKKKKSFLDVCPQCNFTQSLIKKIVKNEVTICDTLLPYVMAGTPQISTDDLLVSVPPFVTILKAEPGLSWHLDLRSFSCFQAFSIHN